MVPQQGHGTVGEAARAVMVTSRVMLICNDGHWLEVFQKAVLLENFVQFFSIPYVASASLRKSQGMGKISEALDTAARLLLATLYQFV
jgi:hypothetical protein